MQDGRGTGGNTGCCLQWLVRMEGLGDSLVPGRDPPMPAISHRPAPAPYSAGSVSTGGRASSCDSTRNVSSRPRGRRPRTDRGSACSGAPPRLAERSVLRASRCGGVCTKENSRTKLEHCVWVKKTVSTHSEPEFSFSRSFSFAT